ncbi:MAG: hypothetical protein M1839_004604 [Geoglossum umbratile]|nr:MAG: hypothetical protein M1839_004604 [Geoglossum umbratile]
MQSPASSGGEPITKVTARDLSQTITKDVSKIESGTTGNGNAAVGLQYAMRSNEGFFPYSTQSGTRASTSKFKYGSNYWSAIPIAQQPAALQVLLEHHHTNEDLERNQYRTRPYDSHDIAGISWCKNCGKQQRYILKSGANADCVFHPEKLQHPAAEEAEGVYPCCGTTKQGCERLPAHDYSNPSPQIVERWQSFIQTPTKLQSSANGTTKRREAVALDCEMVGVIGGSTEVALLSVVDYLTGEVLVNSLVSPTKPVTSWRTQWSGITMAAMTTAITRGETLNGWRGAREELLRHIDAVTILVGHALHNDLNVLRIIHTQVVDSTILAQKAVDTTRRQWGLKQLCNELLHIDVQPTSRRGHDCVEDTLAAREVVMWCTSNPQDLKRWAVAARETTMEGTEEGKGSRKGGGERSKARRARRKKKAEGAREAVGEGKEASEINTRMES